MLLIFLFSL